jgi:hypothetical protein
MAFKYTPETGLNNTTSYPTVPANETAARQQFTDLFGQIRDYVNIYDNYAVDTGAADAYVVTLDPAPTAYTAGMTIAFKAVNANTGASTVNVNGLGVKSLKKNGGTALSSGDIPAGYIVVAIYDGTNFQTDLGLMSHLAETMPHFGLLGTPDLAGKKIEVVAGALRQNTADRTKWDFISDSAHTPVGITGTYATALGGNLTINYAKTYTKVISFVAAPDETLANRYNLSIGGSVGLSSAILSASINKKGSSIIKYDGASWLISDDAYQDLNTSVSYASNTLTVTHDYCPDFDVKITPYFSGYSLSPFIPWIYGNTNNTSFQVRFTDGATGAYYTGAATNQMGFFYSKDYSGPLLLDGTSGTDALALDAGNIWFFGIFEV